MEPAPWIAVVGPPNAGKTALFNALTGSRQKVANYPGVTVERKEGIFLHHGRQTARLIDLPGTYTLRSTRPDEVITRRVLDGDMKPNPAAILCVIDAANIKLHLRLVLELKTLGLPMILALNMHDLAERRGIRIDAARLADKLGIPVIPTVAVRQHGTVAIRDSLSALAENLAGMAVTSLHTELPSPRALDKEVAEVLQAAAYQPGMPPKTTYAIDRWLLHPVFGMVFLLGLLFVVFQAVFAWSEVPMDLIDGGFASLGETIGATLPDGHLKSFLTDGIIAGVGSVVIFLPQILILFFFVLLLEDSGYMARAAFLLDGLMGRVGLHGRAFIPLLSSFACAIPGIMATRIIGSRSDRFATILMAPLMTCSARIPVYTLLIAAFIPDRSVGGFFNLKGVTLFVLYAAGVVLALLIGFILKRTFLKQTAEPFLMELPTYKLPSLKNLGIGLWERMKIFLRRAGTVIFVIMVIIWVLSTFPGAPEGATEPAVSYSFAGMIGQFLAPVFAPIGLGWQAVVALIPGMAAREVAVAALGTVYAVSDASEATLDSLAQTLAAAWTLPAALAFLAWYVAAPQCASTIAVIKRETNSWKWAWGVLIGYFLLAYALAFATYRTALLFSPIS